MSCQLLTQTIGDTKKYTVTFKDSDGNAIDITGATVYLTVKKNKTDSDSDAIFQKTVTSHSDPTNGVTEFTILASDTATIDVNNYVYDIQFVNGTEVKTFLKGRWQVTDETTISIT